MIKHITLWEIIMQQFDAQAFIDFSDTLGYRGGIQSATQVFGNNVNKKVQDLTVPDEERIKNINYLKAFKPHCLNLGLSVATIQIDRMIKMFSEPTTTIKELHEAEEYLRKLLFDEMQSKLFVYIETNKKSLLQDKNLFGEQVAIAFPSTIGDIEEAGKCLAFERWTAAVFHLCRVAEIATVIISKQVGYASPKEGLGEALNYIDANLKKAREDNKNANPLFQGNLEFLSTVTT